MSESDYQAEYRKKNAEKIRAADRSRRLTDEYRERNNARNRASPKKKAWGIVRNRIQNGTLVRGDCVYCGEKNAHAHHENYARPYEIVWVCQRHHSDIHLGVLKVDAEDIFTIPHRTSDQDRRFKNVPPIGEINV